ncbi:MAG: DNA primase [Candidatus Paceibacterota bacterium]
MSSTVEQIKEKLDIATVVSSYLKLDQAGKNLKGKCPFHNEKTPSFFVSPERGTYHCFGCDKGGDVFSFIEEIEGIDFLGALKMLAQKAGVRIEEFNKGEHKKAEKLYHVMERSTLSYQIVLSHNKEALTYLQKRGLSMETIKEFRLGFAKEGWRGLSSELVAQGVSVSELSQAGLVIKKDDGGYYDRFRGRIMFPLFDVTGRVVAFSGRVFKGDEASAKYINNPETELYHKSSILYGLHKAKGEIRREGSCILVEGQMDVLLSHQTGFSNTVATSGTALSHEQLTYLSRLTDTLIIGFDADSAGVAASGRGVDLALAHNFTVKVINLPQGKDPAEIIMQNKDDWKKYILEATNIIDFYLKVLYEQTADEHEYRKAVENKVLPYVSCVKSKIDQAHYISRIADALKISEEPVWQEFFRIQKEGKEDLVRTARRSSSSSQKKQQVPKQETHQSTIEERLLGIILFQQQMHGKEALLKKLNEEYEKITGVSPQERLTALSSEERERKIFEAEMYFDEEVGIEGEVEELLINLREAILRERLLHTMREMKSAETRSDKEDVSRLLDVCNSISKELNKLTASKKPL